MKTFKQHIPEGKTTTAIVKSLGFLLRNKLSHKTKEGKSAKDTNLKLDAMLDAQGKLGSIGIMNLAIEDKGSSLFSRGIIMRGLVEELHAEGTITTKEKELFYDWETGNWRKIQKTLWMEFGHKTTCRRKESWISNFGKQSNRIMPILKP